MAKHQSRKTIQKEDGDLGALGEVEPKISQENTGFATLKEPIVQDEVVALPSPLEILPSDRKDPFRSMASTLQPVEHFLLDHCKSAYARMKRHM